ncbi:MAG TPA: hypothetical protein VIX17_16800 [Pyrinomonadaceae bacterium]|jgi:hypothetical protein
MKRFITSLLSLGDEKEIDRHHRLKPGGVTVCSSALSVVSKLKYQQLQPVVFQQIQI